MPPKPILKRGDPALHEVCAPVTDFGGARKIVAELSDTLTTVQRLYKFTRGSGVAAPQIGYTSRITVVEHDGKRRALINPAIVEHSKEKQLIREGCLSFFAQRGDVERFTSVVVTTLDCDGEAQTIEASGSFAMLLQHEIDHLDGILYVQRLPRGEEDLYLVDNMPAIP